MGIRPQVNPMPSVTSNRSRSAFRRSASERTIRASHPASLKVPPKPSQVWNRRLASMVTLAGLRVGVTSPTFQYESGPDVIKDGSGRDARLRSGPEAAFAELPSAAPPAAATTPREAFSPSLATPAG